MVRLGRKNALAGIQYAGEAGCTDDCRDAVMRLIQFGDRIARARVLTHDRTHCLLLTLERAGDLVAVKSGFGSGYAGQGPSGFSYVLTLLDAHGVEIDEYEVERELMERLDASGLTKKDIDGIEAARPVRPSRWYDYVLDRHSDQEDAGRVWWDFDPVIPLGLVDPRLVDLAMNFRERPGDCLRNGYCRLEDIVRSRTGLQEHGQRLFSQAFGPGGKLEWAGAVDGEHTGRMQLFVATYMAYRNPRAHRETPDAGDMYGEFLLLNHLYGLEALAVARAVETPEQDPPSVPSGQIKKPSRDDATQIATRHASGSNR
jgi:hypothetical protein